MKFLLSCYRVQKRRLPSPPLNDQKLDVTEGPPARRQRSLTPKSASSGATRQWQPALLPISEDGDNVATASSDSKNIATSRSVADEEYSRYSRKAPVIRPSAYWATPFMF